ncbi:MAG: hypothetical protein JNL38_07780 [Myxococcales bacterium]|nr:hypothetical protein [Myxococcales bacterium]
MDDAHGTVEWLACLLAPISEHAGLFDKSPAAMLTVRDSEGRGCFVGFVGPKWRFHFAHDWIRTAMATAERRGAPRPTRLRVNDAELAQVLRAKLTEIEVVLDDATQPPEPHSARDLPDADDSSEERSYFAVDVRERDVAAFFSAMAALQRARVWAELPLSGPLFSLSIDSLAVWEQAVCILQIGPPVLFVFDDAEDFERYLGALRAMSRGDHSVPMPRHVHASYCRAEELSVRAMGELEKYGWEVARLDAVPWLAVVCEDHAAAPETRRESRLMQATARVVAALMPELDALWRAWAGGPAVERAFMLDLGDGPVEARVRAPFTSPAGPALPRVYSTGQPPS